MSKPSKVLVIGSGPIIIGQAAEFDYAGAQACKALREEGVVSVLVNSNPATIMTDSGIADIIYIEPLTVESVSRIIERERPDGLLPTLGGQTGLNLAVALADAGVLEKYNVRLLGTRLESIKMAEDRDLFRTMLRRIGEPVPDSEIVTTMEQARAVARRMGLPLVVRPAFTLGGTGGGIVTTWDELEYRSSLGLKFSPIHQILMERSLAGWKEMEYEVMRDANDTCITICNMENLDPMGVHTGDSIVVAPSQTLTDQEHQMLRTASLKIIRALGIEGGCNIQYALTPHPEVARRLGLNLEGAAPYYVIEVNPRVSRSSALASKATGYPIARVSAKIAVGKRLDEIPNAVTQKTTAAFEPALDYCVVKIPRWPFDKFPSGDRVVGTQMKATGEVMAIDRSFEAALQKAVRSLEMGGSTLLWEDPSWELGDLTGPAVMDRLPLMPANDRRLWALMAALRRGATPEDISGKTGIDPWFLYKMLNVVNMERRLLGEELTSDLLRQAKQTGFSDAQVATLADSMEDHVRDMRRQWGIRPVYKMVDTCAAEFDAVTPYYYSTYDQENEATPLPGRSALILGSGPIRIGQGIEFDYCSVHAAWALGEEGINSIMVNSNPETVSTDFDTSDRLYFEPLDIESVMNIIENEAGDTDDGKEYPPSAVQFGGQTAINLVEDLSKRGMAILGSEPDTIDRASNRRRFSDFLEREGIPQPPGAGVMNMEEALQIAQRLGYPVLVRPSYVLGGRAMEIVHNATELIQFVTAAAQVGRGRPILIDKYIEGIEVEVDAVSDGEDVFIPGIMEHIERAGVHSGDSMAIYPGITLSPEEKQRIVDYTVRIGRGLKIVGLMNIQYALAWNETPEGQPRNAYVLEVNPRSSRTIPFISKITDVPMVKVAVKVMLGHKLRDLGYTTGLKPEKNLVGIKAPVSSMAKLVGVDTYLGPEMKSTGEVMGIDETYSKALAKALIAAGLVLPPGGAVLLSIADRDKPASLPLVRRLIEGGFKIYATDGTAAMIEALGLPVTAVSKIGSGNPHVVDLIRSGAVDGVVNTMHGGRIPLRDGFEIRRAAVESGIPCFTSMDTARAAIHSASERGVTYNIRPLHEYVNRDAVRAAD